MAQAKQKKRKALNRYILLGACVLVVGLISIMSGIVYLMFVEGDYYRAISQKEAVKGKREISPRRGNILGVNGQLLASSQSKYRVYMDFHADGIQEDTIRTYLKPTAQWLAKKFPSRTAAQYQKVIWDAWTRSKEERRLLSNASSSSSKKKIKLRTRYVPIVLEDINYLERQELEQQPYFRRARSSSGLIFEERGQRLKPFGILANRTIGTVYRDAQKGGASGLEMKYDEILRGKPGLASREKRGGVWINVHLVPPEEGASLITTLDMELQDIVQRSLQNKLEELNAESGCAILMETKTGKIRAISNLDRTSEGAYIEGNPNAFSYMFEPGSTFKTISVMIALEDGIVQPTDSFYVGTGLYNYKGRTIRDHYWRKGVDRGYLTLTEGMEVSSNIVVAKAILKGYEDNPTKYVSRIHDMGITRPQEWDVPLKGREGKAYIRYPSDSLHYWSKTTLPWMSFGYETQIPPIHILMFYNAIANGGKMIKPYLVEGYVQNGEMHTLTKHAEVINPAICSQKTLKQIQQMLEGVVKNGTGREIQSPYVSIAGKTGTSLIASQGKYGAQGYYVSFCGYFPTEQPKYTCFVGVRRPQGVVSGGRMSGAVFKQIAEETFALDRVLPLDSLSLVNSSMELVPKFKNGNLENLATVIKTLNIPINLPPSDASWVSVHSDSTNQVEIQPIKTAPNTVPNVKGMGARDALFLLEKQGLKVVIKGYGQVKEQSIAPGKPVSRGATVVLTLE